MKPEEIDAYKQQFAQINRESLRNVAKSKNDRNNTTFSSYSEEDIIRYLRSPEVSAANLRRASRQLYHASTHYRRFINFYADMPFWTYTVSPLNFNVDKKDIKKYRNAYNKAIKYLENANIPHECQKAYLTALIDGVFFGVIWQTKNSFFIQKLNPDYCYISAIEDGRYCFSFDFSKIREEQLYLYPPEFTTLYNQYKATGQKEQEVPSDISFVIKADEFPDYPTVPLSSVMPDVYELETAREILGSATELDNYKLLQMIVETKDGIPTLPMELNKMFLEHIQQSVPPGIGVVMSPGKLQDISFEHSKTTSHSEELASAISNFWYNSGTMGSLFGNPDIITSSAISIAVKVDEAYVYSFMNQFERVFNALLKKLSGTYKFKMQFIRYTVFSKDKVIESYKTAATLGVPGSKVGYAAMVGVPQSDAEGMSFIENDLLDIPNQWIPLKTSYTQTAEEGAGRPAADDEDVSESTTRGRDTDAGQNSEEE